MTTYGSDPMERRQHVEQPGRTDDQTSTETSRPDARRDRHSVVATEKDQYGGIKFGSAFFGWLTATGMAILLTALVAAAGTAIAVSTSTDVGQATNQATQNPETVGLVGGLLLLVIMFVAYFCGGYVAGRMARFNGAMQGVAVWLWAVLIAVAAAIATIVGGSRFNVLEQLNSFPRIPVDEGSLSTAGMVALIAIAVVSLVGAILGGMAGMRFHRKVDKAGLSG